MKNSQIRRGDVIRYPYCWHHASEPNPKNRPVCVVLLIEVHKGQIRLLLTPISDLNTQRTDDAVKIPQSELDKAGLVQSRHAYVHVAEANEDVLYNSYNIGPKTEIIGRLSTSTFNTISERLLHNLKTRNLTIIDRIKNE